MLSVSGCRGITGASFTPMTAARFAAAWAADVRMHRGVERPTLIVGRDGRAGGDALMRSVIASLNAAGCNTIGIGTAATPTVGVIVRAKEADAGLVVTASHNPAEWNGLKPITEAGAAPLPDRMRGLLQRYHEESPAWAPWDAVGTHTDDITADAVHVDAVMGALGAVIDPYEIIEARFKVVVDSVNASGVEGARLLLSRLGCEVVHLNDDKSGLFPHPPEPTAENLISLAEAARVHGPAVAFAQDTDADRLALVTGGGAYIGEEYTLALCAMSLLESMGERARDTVLCANLSTSRMIDDVAARYGARVLRTPVGEANVNRGIVGEEAPLGGEGNGGVIWPAVVHIRDSLGTMALILALLARTGKSLEELVAQIPGYAIEKRKAPIDDALAQKAPALLKAAFEGARVDEQDGIRLDFKADDGEAWLHARASNTEPIYRLIAEAPTPEGARTILDRAESVLGAG